ncbi:zinc finger protein 624 [Patella vulgata]|uniref:zinc finger protein 624 n=1 Tax=Patella vulgata TaxID=6465 RepID=UPI0021803BD8|nr:zinc finger protein 624 [Patella vulgata]
MPKNKCFIKMMEMETNEVKTLHQCAQCDEIFDEYSDLEVHNRIHVKMEKSGHQCSVCDKIFKTLNDLQNHNKLHLKKEKTEDVASFHHCTKAHVKEGETKDLKNFHQCSLCGEMFELYTDLEEHCKIHVKEEKTDDVDFEKACPADFEEMITDAQNHVKVKEEKIYAENCKVHFAEVTTDIKNDVKEEKTDDVKAIHQCKLCYEKFELYTDLVEHCEMHIKEEDSIASTSHQCTSCKKKFTQYSELEKHRCTCTNRNLQMSGESQNTNIVASQNILVLNNKLLRPNFHLETANNSPKSSHTENRQFYQSNICTKEFNQGAPVQSHMKTHVPNTVNDETMETRWDSLMYKCHICGEIFRSSSNLTDHLKLHSLEKKHKCHICSSSYSKKYHLSQHILKAHSSKLKTYKCHCNAEFSSTFDLKEHVQTHTCTDEKPFRCEECGKIYSRKYKLVVHMKSHRTEKLYTCEICSKSFTGDIELKRHVKIHEFNPGNSSKSVDFDELIDKPVQPQVAGLNGQMANSGNFFNFKLQLNNTRPGNTATQTGQLSFTDKPFKCFVCSKTFPLKTGLETHIKVHKKKKCDVCGRSFRDKRAMDIHICSYKRGRSNFKCDICCVTFPFKQSLKTHMESHGIFKCDFCSQSFPSSSDLQEHRIIHSQEKSYKCDVCSKSFPSSNDLQQHGMTHSKKNAF